MGRKMSHGPWTTPLSWRIWTIALQFNSGKSFKQFLSTGKIFDIKKLDTNSAKNSQQNQFFSIFVVLSPKCIQHGLKTVPRKKILKMNEHLSDCTKTKWRVVLFFEFSFVIQTLLKDRAILQYIKNQGLPMHFSNTEQLLILQNNSIF